MSLLTPVLGMTNIERKSYVEVGSIIMCSSALWAWHWCCVSYAAGSDYKDDSLNLMPFFSASCYTGYGDDPMVWCNGDVLSTLYKAHSGCNSVVSNEANRAHIESPLFSYLLNIGILHGVWTCVSEDSRWGGTIHGQGGGPPPTFWYAPVIRTLILIPLLMLIFFFLLRYFQKWLWRGNAFNMRQHITSIFSLHCFPYPPFLPPFFLPSLLPPSPSLPPSPLLIYSFLPTRNARRLYTLSMPTGRAIQPPNRMPGKTNMT